MKITNDAVVYSDNIRGMNKKEEDQEWCHTEAKMVDVETHDCHSINCRP